MVTPQPARLHLPAVSYISAAWVLMNYQNPGNQPLQLQIQNLRHRLAMVLCRASNPNYYMSNAGHLAASLLFGQLHLTYLGTAVPTEQTLAVLELTLRGVELSLQRVGHLAHQLALLNLGLQ